MKKGKVIILSTFLIISISCLVSTGTKEVMAVDDVSPVAIKWKGLEENPLWENIENTVIPKQNAFFMRHTAKTQVIEQTENVIIDEENVSFSDVTDTGSVRITNVGFYEGYSIDVKVSVTKSTKSSQFDLGYTKENFLNWIFKTKKNKVAEIKYDFLITDTETPISIGQYMDYKNIDKNMKLTLDYNSLEKVISKTPTKLEYVDDDNGQNISITGAKSSDSEDDTNYEFVGLFRKSSSIVMEISKDSSYLWALGLYYNGNPKIDIQTSDLEGTTTKTNEITSKDSLITTAFVQTFPYKYNIGNYHKEFKLEIPLENNYLSYDSIDIVNANGQDISENFDVYQAESDIHIVAKETALSNADFYDNMYSFYINYKINYAKEIDPANLDIIGHYGFNTKAKRYLDGEKTITEAKTSVNYMSGVTIKHYLNGEPINHVSDIEDVQYLTQKMTIPTQLDGYDLVSYTPETIDLNQYMAEITEETIVLNYKPIQPPALSVDETTLKVKLSDGLLNIKGSIKIDTPEKYGYAVHLVYGEHNQVVSQGSVNSDGQELDLTVQMNDLTGGNMKAVLYAVDEFGNESNRIDLSIDVIGHLQFNSTPKQSDFGTLKLPDQPEMVKNREQQAFQISDLRGPNKHFQLKLMLTDNEEDHPNNDLGNHFYFKKNKETKIELLVKDHAISIHKGQTEHDNSQNIFDIQFGEDTGLFFKVNPGMKKGSYTGKLIWTLEDVPH